MIPGEETLRRIIILSPQDRHSPMCKVVIADDHPLVRDALRSAVNFACQVEQVFEAGSLDEVTGILQTRGPVDLVLLDVQMPGMNGLAGLLTLRKTFPATPVVIVSASEDCRLMREAVQSGAVGFIPKSTPRDAFAAALRRVMDGDVYVPEAAGDPMAPTEEDAEAAEIARRLATLTAQQMRVLEMLGTGKLNKEIAFDLKITETTVKAHVSAILQKLKVYSRTQAVVFANRLTQDRSRLGY